MLQGNKEGMMKKTIMSLCCCISEAQPLGGLNKFVRTVKVNCSKVNFNFKNGNLQESSLTNLPVSHCTNNKDNRFI